MAPQGKKKKDDRDGSAKTGRTGRNQSGSKRSRRDEDRNGADPASSKADGQRTRDRGGLLLPGENLIGPEAAMVKPADRGEPEATEPTPADLGATRYVHAAFFLAGILVAFVAGKVLGLGWNLLTDWHAAVQAMPSLLHFSEGERATYTNLVGVLVGVLAVVQTYRRENIRKWADEVAAELARVTWPNKETVTNGTVVVIVASIIATAYVALLDQFWGFVTRLIYEA